MSHPTDEQQDIRAGDHWYLKLPGGSALTCMAIMDVTPATVVLCADRMSPYVRYARKDIEWVELAKREGTDISCGLNFGCTLPKGHDGPCGWPKAKTQEATP